MYTSCIYVCVSVKEGCEKNVKGVSMTSDQLDPIDDPRSSRSADKPITTALIIFYAQK